MKKIILGVTGSISAYKAADIASQLVKEDYDVHVVMTHAGAAFITPLTLQALTKNRVHVDVLQEAVPEEIIHITLPQSADLFLIAPATANIIGKIAHGIGDDLLSTMALALPAQTPKLFAPAMNTKMYENRIVVQNMELLLTRGWERIEPRASRLACGDVGTGALATVDTIVSIVRKKIEKDFSYETFH